MSQQESQGQSPSGGNTAFAVKLFAVAALVIGLLWLLDKGTN